MREQTSHAGKIQRRKVLLAAQWLLKEHVYKFQLNPNTNPNPLLCSASPQTHNKTRAIPIITRSHSPTFPH